MRDKVELAAVPTDEPCEQVGPNCNYERMRMECRAFAEQLRRQLGREPEGAQLSVKSNPHEFGPYYEVVCYYDVGNTEAMDYAWGLEANLPAKWDSEALQYLAQNR